jgi:hypothetical protein
MVDMKELAASRGAQLTYIHGLALEGRRGIRDTYDLILACIEHDADVKTEKPKSLGMFANVVQADRDAREKDARKAIRY